MLSVLKRSAGCTLVRRFSCLLSQPWRVSISASSVADGRCPSTTAGGPSSCLGLSNTGLLPPPLHRYSLSTSLANYNSERNSQGTSRIQDLSTAPVESGYDTLSKEEKLLLVQTELELARENGEDVPTYITDQQWQELVTFTSSMSRKRYLRYISITNHRKMAEKKTKEKNRQVLDRNREEVCRQLVSNPDTIFYGLWRNSIFLKAESQYMSNGYHHRVFNACMYGQHIILDNGFGNHMNLQEEKNLVNQLNEAIGLNRAHRDPYYLHICNFDAESRCADLMKRSMPTLLDQKYPMDVHKENYLDLFDKKKLVYLTPHCNEEMEQYDHDAIYIIGNIVDKGVHKPLTLAKAKREGIKMLKFPLEKYLDWGNGSKLLTIDQVMGIMLEIKHTGSWVKAFKKHVPVRKLKRKSDDAEQLKKKYHRSKAVKNMER